MAAHQQPVSLFADATLDGARAQVRRPLADVALAADFVDQAHLSRMFTAAVGITPARYRELAEVKTGDTSSA
jgi:transcriptional regulator GlxA family with amidase domain